MMDIATLISGDLFAQIIFLTLLGAVAGVLAGLLGIGGGIVLVPGLFLLFKAMGYDADLWMHMAVGTSLAVIIPAGLSSARAHHRRGAVRFDLVRRIGVGIVAGVVVGTWIAAQVDGRGLLMVFAVALTMLAFLMLFPLEQIKNFQSRRKSRDEGASRIKGDAVAFDNPAPEILSPEVLSSENPPSCDADEMQTGPVQPYATIGGAGIGVLSTLMGIGGATLNVPFMTLNGVPIHKAVGSASAMGPLIALPGAIGFAVIGWAQTAGMGWTLGYINLLALCVIAPVAAIAAPFGARIAHSLNVAWLRRVFAIFLVIVASRMVWEAMAG